MTAGCIVNDSPLPPRILCKIAEVQNELLTAKEYVEPHEHAPQMKAADAIEYRQTARRGTDAPLVIFCLGGDGHATVCFHPKSSIFIKLHINSVRKQMFVSVLTYQKGSAMIITEPVSRGRAPLENARIAIRIIKIKRPPKRSFTAHTVRPVHSGVLKKFLFELVV